MKGECFDRLSREQGARNCETPVAEKISVIVGEWIVINHSPAGQQRQSGKVGIAVCMADTEGMNAEKANIEAFFKSIKPVK